MKNNVYVKICSEVGTLLEVGPFDEDEAVKTLGEVGFHRQCAGSEIWTSRKKISLRRSVAEEFQEHDRGKLMAYIKTLHSELDEVIDSPNSTYNTGKRRQPSLEKA